MIRVPVKPDILRWARERSGIAWEDLAERFKRPPGWESGNAYQPAAVSSFVQVADYWLRAHALALRCTVVAREVPADTIRKIKIPNACIGLGLRCVSPCEMLRREQAGFVLSSARDAA